MQKEGHLKTEDRPPTHPGGVGGTGEEQLVPRWKRGFVIQAKLVSGGGGSEFLCVWLFMFLYVVSMCAFLKSLCYLGIVRLSKTVN